MPLVQKQQVHLHPHLDCQKVTDFAEMLISTAIRKAAKSDTGVLEISSPIYYGWLPMRMPTRTTVAASSVLPKIFRSSKSRTGSSLPSS